MKFRTEINLKDAPKILSPERPVLLAGSCFSDNIGSLMRECGWPVVVNPCGVIYNPVSMAILFRLALSHRSLRHSIIESAITQREGKYVSWFMGSVAMDTTVDGCIAKVADAIDDLEEAIEKSDAIILTFGTSDVWLLKGTDCAVGNCHKHPASEFIKKRVGIGDIVNEWKEIIKMVRERNPQVKVILTVSPRRYLSESFADNTRQKAVLILASESLCSEIPGVVYFPAYEILNDDLRDYRYYKRDLLHPSEMAIDYVWEKFKEAFLDSIGISKIQMMEKERRRNAHIQKN